MGHRLTILRAFAVANASEDAGWVQPGAFVWLDNTLAAAELQSFRAACTNEAIDDRVLTALNESHLELLGIIRLGDRLCFMHQRDLRLEDSSVATRQVTSVC